MNSKEKEVTGHVGNAVKRDKGEGGGVKRRWSDSSKELVKKIRRKKRVKWKRENDDVKKTKVRNVG